MRLLSIGKVHQFTARDQLRENVLKKTYFIEVDMGDLIQFDDELASELKKKPKLLMPCVSICFN